MKMTSLVFATGNAHKVREVREILGPAFRILTAAEIGFADLHLPETSDTLTDNAVEKATALHEACHQDCFAEDTGLEVDALDGLPGVHTARYAGPGAGSTDNIMKLLDALQGVAHRDAQFRTVIALWWHGTMHLFEGIVRGRIALAVTGEGGFGYDPVFIPEGYDLTFAQLPSAVKNRMSHRARAAQGLRDFFKAGHT